MCGKDTIQSSHLEVGAFLAWTSVSGPGLCACGVKKTSSSAAQSPSLMLWAPVCYTRQAILAA